MGMLWRAPQYCWFFYYFVIGGLWLIGPQPLGS